ncbi:hypothetical protein E4U43_005038 [Claviceps pusilla]|uniref:Uncharacterized protein n=1 Tax=Claviceps pusilla TaxID=123648 RepID=A0A9P7N4Z4_9HYPO|nr:hypothetical protein E4U43_005038 [Claviceps pusilla]
MADACSGAPNEEHVRKLGRVPKAAHIQKRPLLRPQLSSSSKSPTIYMSSKTPFLSAVRRVRKLLTRSLRCSPAPKHASLQSRVAALKRSTNTAAGDGSDARPLAVTVMGTGKAIEKTLSLASWFEQQGDCEVSLRTRTIKTVDDIVLRDGDDGEGESRVRNVSCLEVVVTLK